MLRGVLCCLFLFSGIYFADKVRIGLGPIETVLLRIDKGVVSVQPYIFCHIFFGFKQKLMVTQLVARQYTHYAIVSVAFVNIIVVLIIAGQLHLPTGGCSKNHNGRLL